MRRLPGLFKEYDIVELTEDVPSANLKKGDIGTIVSIAVGRGGASATIELHEEFVGPDGDSCPVLELSLGIMPPLKLIEAQTEFQTGCDRFNCFPKDLI